MTTLGTLAITLPPLALLITLSHLVSCVIRPFGPCPRCQGYGHLRGWLSGIRICAACDGTGIRLRLGRRVINTFRRLYRDR